MKQTAMQELLEEVILEREKSISVEFREALDFVITAIKIDYKEMEKKQMFEYIKNNYCIGHRSLEFHRLDFEQYYNETFNK